MYQAMRFETMASDEVSRRVRELDLHSSTFLRSPPTSYDPVLTPLFTTLFTSLGFTGSFFGVSTASFLATAASALVTTAASLALNSLFSSSAPEPPQPENGKIPLQQARPYRQWVVGRARIAGAYMLFEAVGNRLCAVQAVAAHKVRSFNRFYLHDDEVTLTGSIVNGLDDGRYAGGNVSIFSRQGNAVETAYSDIVTAISDASIWSTSHRGDGQASMAMIARSVKAQDQLTRFPYGAPRLSSEVDGAYLYDPRDITQSPDNPDTWKWSKNAALVMLWHQCFNELGHRRNFARAILPVIDVWIEEANICDENVPTAAGGSEKRYEVGGFDTAENDPKIATNAILAACDGWLCERGDGALLFRVGKFREALVATLTDADIIGHKLDYDVLPEDEVNRLVPKFTYPATNYATSDTDYFEDTDRQLVAGRVLSRDASYMWCQSWRQARRLGIRDWRRIQEKMRGNINVRQSGINAIYSRWIRLLTPLGIPKLDGKVIENRRSILSITAGGYGMDFVKHPENIDDWNPSTDEGRQPPVPSAPNAAGLDTPAIYSVVAIASAGSVYLSVQLIDPNDSSLSAALRYRVVDAGGGIPGNWVQKNFGSFTASGGYVALSTDIVPANQALEIEAAWLTTTGKYSNWSAADTVFSTADSVPPGNVTIDAIITGIPNEVTYKWTAPNSGNYAGAKVFYNTVNNPATATLSAPEIMGVANGSYQKTIALSPGNYFGWVLALNASGVAGSFVSVGPFTVS